MLLRELYQELILDHNRNPRNHYVMKEATVEARGFNPLCGDKLTLYLKIKENIVEEVSFLGVGCAISQASASLMTEALKGKTLAQAHDLFTDFHQMILAQKEDETGQAALGKLAVLAGVKAYPARVKCATLAWHTLDQALSADSLPTTVISTE